MAGTAVEELTNTKNPASQRLGNVAARVLPAARAMEIVETLQELVVRMPHFTNRCIMDWEKQHCTCERQKTKPRSFQQFIATQAKISCACMMHARDMRVKHVARRC